MTPIVIPLHHRGGKLRNNTEAMFAIRSIERHFKEPFQLAIVGQKMPGWAQGIKHIPQPSGGLKTALRLAAETFPDGFFWLYDDCCLLRDTDAETMKVTPACKGWSGNRTGWARKLDSIRKRLVKEGLTPWDYSRPHGPYWFTKEMVDAAFTDWPGMASKFPFESWILSKYNWPRRHGVVRQYYGPWMGAPGDGAWFMNHNDKGNTPQLREWLRERFPEPSQFEIVTPKRALSYSIFGNDRLYNIGIVENAKLAKEFYPGWDFVVHAENGHPTIPPLEAEGAIVIQHDPERGLRGTFWRFETISPRYDAVVCRDADCRISARERAAVDDWLNAGTALHTMWDFNRKRAREISAGMFGIRPAKINIAAGLKSWERTGSYGDDENFLNVILWPKLSTDVTAHRRTRRRANEVNFPPVASDKHVGMRVTPDDHVATALPIYRIGTPRAGETAVGPVFGIGQWAGNAAAHFKAAAKALEDDVFPCLVLEDDAEWILPPPAEWPSESWVWIGLSRFQMTDAGKGARMDHKAPPAKGMIPMGRMCANHGLALLSRQGAVQMMESAGYALNHNVPIDIGVIRMCEAKGWERKGLAFPLVYQKGKNMRDTRFHLGSEKPALDIAAS